MRVEQAEEILHLCSKNDLINLKRYVDGLNRAQIEPIRDKSNARSVKKKTLNLAIFNIFSFFKPFKFHFKFQVACITPLAPAQ
jgi:hypothetical protein